MSHNMCMNLTYAFRSCGEEFRRNVAETITDETRPSCDMDPDGHPFTKACDI